MRNALLSAFLLVCTTSVFGQAAPMPLGYSVAGINGDGTFLLLRMRDVHRELKLQDQQVSQVRAILTSVPKKRRILFQNLLDGKVFEQELSESEIRDLFSVFNREADQSLMDVLSGSQKERLAQLKIQLWGVNAFQDERIASVLMLSEYQLKAINSNKKNASEDPAATASKTEQKMLNVLAADQRIRWKELQGKPFPFAVLRQRLSGPTPRPTPERFAVHSRSR